MVRFDCELSWRVCVAFCEIKGLAAGMMNMVYVQGFLSISVAIDIQLVNVNFRCWKRLPVRGNDKSG